MIRRSLLLVSAVLLVASGLAVRVAARQTPAAAPAVAPAVAPPAPPTPPTPTFRSGVDSVTVDAVVTDKQGRPITDLTPADFEVRESGKLQTIQTFKFVKIDDGIDDPVAQREILSFDDQKRETAREDNRLFVIFLDDYHTQLANSLNIRLRLADFVRQLTPHDLVAVVGPWATVTSLTFSRDHDSTANEIMAFQGRKYNYTPKNAIEEQYASQPPDQQEQFRNDVTIGALSRLCNYLGSLRDGRKSILYVSEGMDGTLPAGIHVQGLGSYGGTTVTQQVSSPIADMNRIVENGAIGNELRDVFIEAARSNTSIYTIDPRGLIGLAFGADNDVSIQDAVTTSDDETNILRIVAENTDGRAFVGRNDPMPQLKEMVQDSSTYYLLGYTSSLAPRDGKFHEIQVRVKRKDVEVRARKGYWAYSPDDVARASAIASKPGPSADVTEALDALASSANSDRRKPVQLWLGAVRGDAEKPRVTLVWEVPLSAAPTDPVDTVDHVDVTVTTIQGEDVYRGPAPRASDPIRTAGHVQFDAPAGGIHIHLVASNAKGQRVDTDDSDFTVPDFTAAGPLISTPEVFSGRTAHDLQVARTAASPVPTSVRSFSRTARLLIRFGAYGPGGTAPAVTMQVLNQSGASIATLPAPTAGAGNIDEAEFGLDNFPPGDYLIQITATASGESSKKLFAIRVTG